MSNIQVPRVELLDSITWNEELYNHFISQLKKSLQYFPTTVIMRMWPEIEAFSRYMFLDLSLRSYQGTFGQNLFSIVYKDRKWKLRTLAALTLVPWIWARVMRKAFPSSPHLVPMFDISERRFIIAFKLLSLLNFCVFLNKGKYPSIYDRLLGLVPTYESRQLIREVSYESISREILWHGFAELFSFILPIINVHRIKNNLSKIILRFSSKERELHFTNCGVCGATPTNPSEIGCGHVFCYYCIMSNVMADAQYSCSCGYIADGTCSVKPMSINTVMK